MPRYIAMGLALALALAASPQGQTVLYVDDDAPPGGDIGVAGDTTDNTYHVITAQVLADPTTLDGDVDLGDLALFQAALSGSL